MKSVEYSSIGTYGEARGDRKKGTPHATSLAQAALLNLSTWENGNMIDFETGRGPAVMSGHKVTKSRRGRLTVNVPNESFQSSFVSFTTAAENFARPLSDALLRVFAYQYLSYLQEVARGARPPRPSSYNGRPACRLIRNEMERLFRHHFSPDEAIVP